MNRLLLASLLSVPALAFACGGISDPTRQGESVATVSGALTGTSVPAGARVALVWRNPAGGVVAGAEAPIVNGQFSMALAPPPDAYFFSTEGGSYEGLAGSGGSVDEPPMAGGTAPSPGGGSGGAVPEEDQSGGGTPGSGGGKLGTKTNVSGGITEPMKAAAAGFIVYVDENGNGKLDLEGDYASSPDTILGGNKELILAYLKGGGQLDYEKLRDKSGILPAAGYNLAWEQGRWVPLTLVELKLTSSAKLPSPVCASWGGVDETQPMPAPEPAPLPPDPDVADAGAAPASYPDPNDPNLSCSPDGKTYYYFDPSACPPPPPPPVGLCAPDYGTSARACASEVNSFAGDTPPAGWPCPVDPPPPAEDGGPAPDAGAN